MSNENTERGVNKNPDMGDEYFEAMDRMEKDLGELLGKIKNVSKACSSSSMELPLMIEEEKKLYELINQYDKKKSELLLEMNGKGKNKELSGAFVQREMGMYKLLSKIKNTANIGELKRFVGDKILGFLSDERQSEVERLSEESPDDDKLGEVKKRIATDINSYIRTYLSDPIAGDRRSIEEKCNEIDNEISSAKQNIDEIKRYNLENPLLEVLKSLEEYSDQKKGVKENVERHLTELKSITSECLKISKSADITKSKMDELIEKASKLMAPKEASFGEEVDNIQKKMASDLEKFSTRLDVVMGDKGKMKMASDCNLLSFLSESERKTWKNLADSYDNIDKIALSSFKKEIKERILAEMTKRVGLPILDGSLSEIKEQLKALRGPLDTLTLRRQLKVSYKNSIETMDSLSKRLGQLHDKIEKCQQGFLYTFLSFFGYGKKEQKDKEKLEKLMRTLSELAGSTMMREAKRDDAIRGTGTQLDKTLDDASGVLILDGITRDVKSIEERTLKL